MYVAMAAAALAAALAAAVAAALAAALAAAFACTGRQSVCLVCYVASGVHTIDITSNHLATWCRAAWKVVLEKCQARVASGSARGRRLGSRCSSSQRYRL